MVIFVGGKGKPSSGILGASFLNIGVGILEKIETIGVIGVI